MKVYLNANVTEILTTADASEATAVDAVSFHGNRLRVRSRVVVLAAGGIENARLLLASGGRRVERPGQREGSRGSVFHGSSAPLSRHDRILDKSGLPDLYDPYYKFRKRKRSVVGVYDETLVAGSLNLKPEFQEQEELLNYRAWIVAAYPADNAPAIDALKRLDIAASERALPRETLAADLKSVLLHPRDRGR